MTNELKHENDGSYEQQQTVQASWKSSSAFALVEGAEETLKQLPALQQQERSALQAERLDRQ